LTAEAQNAMPPCDQFTALDTRRSEPSRCDVCAQPEADHEKPGRRTVTGAEVEELRRRMLMELYEKMDAQGPRHEGDRPI
jgi:hypothetical protein